MLPAARIVDESVGLLEGVTLEGPSLRNYDLDRATENPLLLKRTVLADVTTLRQG